jgi:NAD(P)-dependent dehydrogenase (short-subunit alcohol dehydrogenase family)
MKQAIITGGARGIGSGIAQAMLAAGYAVAVTGLTEDEVSAVPPREGLTAIRLDVTDDACVAAMLARFETLDALVNCAGMIARGAEYDIAVFQKVVEVNLTGTMRMCLAAQQKLAARGGSIVNTASMLSYFGGPLVPAYTASKGGVMQLTKALAVAWAKDGIRVNAIAPGWIATEMTGALRQDEARAAAILSRTPMGRWGEPVDIGGAVVFLCSEAAAFVTGTILPIDGGYAAM